jgi:hypothetical protein
MEDQTDFMVETEESERPVERLLAPPPTDTPLHGFRMIERVVLDPGADVEKLKGVMSMYEQLKAKEAELAYNSAKGRILRKLARIKIVKNRSALHQIEKGKPAKGTSFKYAPLEEIDKHLRPLLVAEEMDLSFSDELREDRGILIRGRLKHLPSGHFEDSFMSASAGHLGRKVRRAGSGQHQFFPTPIHRLQYLQHRGY